MGTLNVLSRGWYIIKQVLKYGSCLAIAVSAYFAYQTYQKSIKITDLTIRNVYHSDLLRSLGAAVDKMPERKIDLKVDGRNLESLYLYYYSIKNKGNTPILPKDFIEPITVSIEEPWEIMYIGSASKPRLDAPIPKWERINKRLYRMSSTLFNPGDHLSLHIYVTKGLSSALKKVEDVEDVEDAREAPNLRWNGRIVNVKSIFVFESSDDVMKRLTEKYIPSGFFNTFILLSGWNVLWFLLISQSFFAGTVLLVIHAKRLTMEGWQVILLLSVVMFFSVSSAEVVVHLITKPPPGLLWPGSWVLIVLHALLLLYIVFPVARR